jgi:hypothetical protein
VLKIGELDARRVVEDSHADAQDRVAGLSNNHVTTEWSPIKISQDSEFSACVVPGEQE